MIDGYRSVDDFLQRRGMWSFHWRARRVLFFGVQSDSRPLDHALSELPRTGGGFFFVARRPRHTICTLGVILGVRLLMSAAGFQLCHEEKKARRRRALRCRHVICVSHVACVCMFANEYKL